MKILVFKTSFDIATVLASSLDAAVRILYEYEVDKNIMHAIMHGAAGSSVEQFDLNKSCVVAYFSD